MHRMPNLSDNLNFLLQREHLTVTELARRVKIPQPVLYRMCVGKTYNPNVLSLTPIAKYFNISISQLIGDDPIFRNPTDGNLKIRYIPIIGWNDCIQWPKNKSNLVIHNNILSDAKGSADVFGLIVEDELMGFIKDTALIFDPNKKPKHKDYTLLQKKGYEQPFVRQLITEHDNFYLKPLNDYSKIVPFDDDSTILGVLIQWTSFGVQA